MTDPIKQVRGGRPAARLRALVKREGTHVCWLCGTPINMALGPHAPMGWTMDHVLPVSTYPHLAFALANIREAHRKCNSSKGNREAMIVDPNASRSW